MQVRRSGKTPLIWEDFQQASVLRNASMSNLFNFGCSRALVFRALLGARKTHASPEGLRTTSATIPLAPTKHQPLITSHPPSSHNAPSETALWGYPLLTPTGDALVQTPGAHAFCSTQNRVSPPVPHVRHPPLAWEIGPHSGGPQGGTGLVWRCLNTDKTVAPFWNGLKTGLSSARFVTFGPLAHDFHQASSNCSHMRALK